jgi:hypothetical protein
VKPFYPSSETVLPIKRNRSTYQTVLPFKRNLHRYIEVAEIVAESMDNYLLFESVIKVRLYRLHPVYP